MEDSKLSENELITRLESSRRRLRSSGGASLPASTNALTACHMTTQTVAYLVTNRPLTDKAASSKWHKRVFLLETAVAEALTGLKGAGNGGNYDKNAHLCSSYQELLDTLWETSESKQAACHAVTEMTRLGALLGCCWLLYDRGGKLKETMELLRVISDFCLLRDSTQYLAKWPLFFLAMVKMVEMEDHRGALGCFRKVVVKSGYVEDASVDFHYWYAVSLIWNGLAMEAVDELDKCISGNYEPVMCLSLQAMVHLQTQDYHAAVEKLQRALEIDFSQPTSLFNYALLLGRLENFEAQQQMLEYVLDSLETSDDGQHADKHSSDDAPSLETVNASAVIFDDAKAAVLLPSRVTSVSTSKVNLLLAVASMENESWFESKEYFDAFFRYENYHTATPEAVRDYIYVLLQCNLPSLALSNCTEFLSRYEDCTPAQENAISVSLLLLYLYTADALLCLENVHECCEYLKQTVQPKIQDALRRQRTTPAAQSVSTISAEVVSCHVQLLNNLAVATVCHDGVDAAIVILREGLQLYPGCLALKFNLVLLLWRKNEKTVACAMWVEARGWNTTKSSDAEFVAGTGDVSPVALVSAYESSVVSAQDPAISQHVQSDGEGNVSAQQLKYLDALILSHWRKTRNAKLLDNSVRYVEYLENSGTSNSIRQK